MSTPGEHLVRADRRFATGGGTLARLAAPAISKILDQIDTRLQRGGIHLTLPDGTEREVGFRSSGPDAVVILHSWMALLRLATAGSVGWYKAWTLGEWSSPEPVDIFELFSANAAQLREVHTLLDRLALRPRDRLLEIGCGWGTLAIEAAKRGAEVVGLTLSKEQKAWAEDKIAKAGLSHQIEIRLQDYRDTAEQFDAVASVEMVEAVGQRWWPAYLDCIARNLKPGGRAAIQFISIDHAIFNSYVRSPDFIQAYIFPGGCLIDEPQFAALAKERGLSWDDREGFALDYAETLKRWRDRYNAAVTAGRLKGFGEAFHQLWRYYLMYCEGGFRGGAIDVAQATLVKAQA